MLEGAIEVCMRVRRVKCVSSVRSGKETQMQASVHTYTHIGREEDTMHMCKSTLSRVTLTRKGN